MRPGRAPGRPFHWHGRLYRSANLADHPVEAKAGGVWGVLSGDDRLFKGGRGVFEGGLDLYGRVPVGNTPFMLQRPEKKSAESI